MFNYKSTRILLGMLLFSTYLLSFANDNNVLQQLRSTPSSPDEVLKIVQNPQNQNNVELVMFILKNIEDLNIIETDKKIEFVNNFNVSDEIKSLVKTAIENHINYSDHKRITYGLYEFNKCRHTNYMNRDDPKLPNYILFNNRCYYQEYYAC